MRDEAHRSPESAFQGSAGPGSRTPGETLHTAKDGETRGPGRGLAVSFERYGLPTAVLDVREAAAFLAVTPGTVYRLVRSGELAHTRIGRALRFRVADLEAYLAS